MACLDRSHAAILDVLFEDPDGATTQTQQVIVAHDPMGADEGADDETLNHGRDPGSSKPALPLTPVERQRPHDVTVVAPDGVVPEPLDLLEKDLPTRRVIVAQRPLQLHERIPRDIRGIVRNERSRPMDWDAARVELHRVAEQALGKDVVMQRVVRPREGGLLDRIFEAKLEDFVAKGADGPPPPIRPRHRFSTSQFSSARCVSPETSRTCKASSGRLTIGYPCRLNDVFSTPPMPVRLSNSFSRRW